jgi:hypothetical protein
MRGATAPRRSPTPVNPPPLVDRTKTIRHIRALIWLYLVLLVFEGALRKWIVPQLSNPLLIIRDPVVIAIYLLALRARVFPRNRYVISLGVIAVLSMIVSVIVLSPYIPMKPIVEVTLYGFRSNFLHLPLIFVMGAVMNEDDVKKIGWWILVGMIPMSLIMVAQFKAAPDSFINRAVGLGEGQQLTAGGGKIRPPGTFSFISGPIFYVSVATAFAIYGALSRSTYKFWLLVTSAVALVIAIAVSGSRGCVASALLVVAAILVILLLKPRAVNQFGWALLIVVIGGLTISHLPIFKEGVGILSERFTSSAEATDTTVVKGMIERTISGFTEGLKVLDKLPLAGYGLGIGTAGGARFLVGRAAFLLAENEWSRVLLESGPILGLAFLLWRTALTFRLGYTSVVLLRRGAILPILIFASGFVALLNGQLGQPTNLGFAAFLNGLCLAATQMKKPDTGVIASNVTNEPAPKRIPRRSDYASRLHSPGGDQTNGFVDR